MNKTIKKILGLAALIIVGYLFNYADNNFDSQNIWHVLILCVVFIGGAIWIIKELKKPELPEKTDSLEKYIDLGTGLDWFKQYKESGAKTLSDFFNLHKENKVKIEAVISKTGFYQTPEGKRWAVIAKHYQYFDKNNKKEHTFYCPGFDYDPINDFTEGQPITVWIERDNYSKYDIQAY
ncbi:hypothetical protein EOM71_02875 [Candidatus Falkowbacteria bacterium]|nr:hypothetical protein [Candidatus Falkowbacteria bacterium]